MRTEFVPILIAPQLAMMLAGHFAAPAQTNQIAQLLTTNRPGQYRLEPAWIGESRATVKTGFFATQTNTPAQDRSERELRFDLFSFFEKPSAMPLGSRSISQSVDQTKEGWRHTNLHIHRASFPTDAELTEAHTVGALTNLLGPSWGFKDAWGDTQAMHSQAGWSYFRMKDVATLETLSVFCFTTYTNGQSEEYVDSIRIRRGAARSAR